MIGEKNLSKFKESRRFEMRKQIKRDHNDLLKTTEAYKNIIRDN